MITLKRFWAFALVLSGVLGVTPSHATSTVSLERWLFETAKELPRSHAPGESPDDELSRLERISRSLARSVVPYADGHGWAGSELAMAVLILVNEETRFDERIHSGTGHPVWNEDRGLAKCLGQLHESGLVPREVWATLAGSDEESTDRCAAATAKVWVSVSRQCGVWYGQRASRERVAAAFMAYGSGGSCTPDDRAWSRADKWLARMAKRPDKSPVKGYRRVMPSEVAPGAQEEARALLAEVGQREVGFTKQTEIGDKRWAFRIENHADGKVGVSVFVAEK